MEKSKVQTEYHIEEDQKHWLERMAKEYGLPDPSKALRALLDFAMVDGDKDQIFKQIRCYRCG